MGKDELRRIGGVIVGLVRGDDPASHRGTIGELCAAFPLP
jgi:hypothetical protein